jgi:hypothetical protein
MSGLKAKTFGELLKARGPQFECHRAEEGPTRTTTRRTRNKMMIMFFLGRNVCATHVLLLFLIILMDPRLRGYGTDS